MINLFFICKSLHDQLLTAQYSLTAPDEHLLRSQKWQTKAFFSPREVAFSISLFSPYAFYVSLSVSGFEDSQGGCSRSLSNFSREPQCFQYADVLHSPSLLQMGCNIKMNTPILKSIYSLAGLKPSLN